ncbi:MAG TPA: MFS transporter [Candidatus Acidoferrum sp.]|jgi:UMF1 family MFS transporter|nr:MFS transporter [Candidatus Acidoferrum sp.]
MTAPPGPRRWERIGWYAYDFGNSAFSTTVVTVFLGPHLTAVTRAAADARGFVYPLGIPVHAGSFFPYVVALSVLLQVAVLPILGAVADFSGGKKRMLIGFAYAGSLSTMALYFVERDRWLLGGLLFVVANVSFGASIVVYNAYLPELATPAERDAVSSRGWAVGYLGGGLLLALNLWLVAHAASLGLDIDHAVRISLASAGMWWAVATVFPLASLKSRPGTPRPPRSTGYVRIGFTRTWATLAAIGRRRHTLRFLAAYLLYNDGVQTVITLASQFGQEELGLSMTTLATVILMVQFVACLGALLFERVARHIGAKRTVLVGLAGWTASLVFAYAALAGVGGFYVLGAVIALVLGGTQALSRSLYSLMIPAGQEAEYYALYEVSDRGTSWLGPLLFGLTLQLTGSYRLAILSLVAFFLAGAMLLARTDMRLAAIEAGNEPPPRE